MPQLTKKEIAIIIATIIVIAGFVVWKTTKNPTPPTEILINSEVLETFPIPRYKEIELRSASKNEFNQTKVVFTSSALIEELLDFYNNWAKENNYILVNKERFIERPQEAANKYAFSLTPSISNDIKFAYHFNLEFKDDGNTQITISYLPFDKEKNVPVDIKVPEGFKLKF